MFDIKIKDIPGSAKTKLIEFIGELTALGSSRVSEEVLPLIEKGCKHLIGDLTKLEYTNSTGLLCLLRCHMKITKINGSFKLFGVKKNIFEILEQVGVTKLLPIYETISEVKKVILKTRSKRS